MPKGVVAAERESFAMEARMGLGLRLGSVRFSGAFRAGKSLALAPERNLCNAQHSPLSPAEIC